MLKAHKIIGIVIICFVIFGLLSIGCSQKDLTGSNQQTTVIITEPILGDVTLSQADSQSFINILNKKEELDYPIPLAAGNDPSEIKMKIINNHSEKEINIGPGSSVIMDNKVYKCDPALYNMAYTEILSPANLANVIANGTVCLEAGDTGNKIEIKGNDLIELADSLNYATLDQDNSRADELAAGRAYPAYVIGITKDNQQLNIEVENDQLFWLSRFATLNYYHQGNMVWNYCKEKLPAAPPDSTDIKYLFLAKSLQSPELKIILDDRIVGISRLFSTKTPIDEPIGEVRYTLRYKYNDGKELVVKIGKNKFEFLGKTYYLENIGDTVLSAVKAG
jgi:hypothetical protein